MARSRSGFSKPNRVQRFPKLQPIESERTISGARGVVKLFLMNGAESANGCRLSAIGSRLSALGFRPSAARKPQADSRCFQG